MPDQLEFSTNKSDEACFEEVLNIYEIFTKTSEIPVDTFNRFVVSLCRIVNIESYSQKAWSIVRDIAQSNQSSPLISNLLSILNDPYCWNQPIILRGSVFFLGMSLWGYHRIETLDIPYNVVLTYFYYVLSCKHGLVVNEVLKTIRRLISKFGPVLKVEYQIISKILSKSRQILEIHADETILSTLMDILRSIQKQKKTNKFLSEYDIGLNTIAPLTSLLDEDIIITYLDDIKPSLTILDTSWKGTLEIILKSFFVRDNRTNVRKKVLEIVRTFYESNVDTSGDDILQVSIPIMKHAFDDMDDTIIELYLDLYFFMCQNVSNQKFLVLIENVYQLLYSPNTSILTKRRIVVHFNRLFINKLPSTNTSQVIEIFKKLIKFVSYNDQFIRAESIKILSNLSGTHKYTIKYKDIHCPHIKFYSKSSSNKNQKLFPVHELIEEFRNRIKKEESRDIFYLLIQGILGFFYNGWILVQADISSLSTLVCRLLENKIFGFFLNQKELDPTKDNNVNSGYEIILSSLCYLLPRESEISELLINTLATSITEGFSKNYFYDYRIQLCLRGLIQCSLYKPDLFSKMLPSILDSIEKICSKIDTFTETKIYLIDFVYILSLRNELAKTGIIYSGKVVQILIGFFKGNPDMFILHYAFQALISWFNQFDNQTRLNYFETVRKKIRRLKNKINAHIMESYMDLLTKIVFIDCNPMLLKEETFLFKENDDIKISGWIKGNSLLIIKTNKMGWSQVTVRRPSGKYTWMMQIQNKLRNIKSSITSIVEIPPSYFEFLNEGIFESANTMSNEIEELKDHLIESMSFDSPRIKRIVEDISHTTEEHPNIFLDIGDMEYSDDLFDVPLSPKNRRSIVKDDEGYISSVSTSSYSQLPSYEESYQEEYEEEESIENDLDISNEEQDNTIKHDQSSDSIKIRIMKDSEEDKLQFSRSYEKNRLGRSKSDENIITQEILESKKYEMPFSEKFKKPTRIRPSKRSSSFSKRLSTDINLYESFDEVKKSIRKSKFIHENEMTNNKPIDRQALTAKPYPLIKKRSEDTLVKRIPDKRFSVDHNSRNKRNSQEYESKQTLIHPSFIFLQFQQLPNIKSYSDRLQVSKHLEEAVKSIDEIPSYETFAANVLYVGYTQTTSEEILSNLSGSLEYENFISGLGNFKRLKDCKYYTGGLDTSNDIDGKYFVLFMDRLRHIAFHISTMLPNKHNQNDSNIDVANKINIMKNNLVTIVWNEYSNGEYDISHLKELHEYITIVITPLEKKLYKIKIKSEIDIPFLTTILETQVIGEEILCDLIRFTTINAYFIVQRYLYIQGRQNIVSNFEKRLHFVQSLKEKFHAGNSLKSPRKK